MVLVVVSFLGFGLPWESFNGVLLVLDGAGCYVLDVVEPAAASQLVSEYCCCILCRFAHGRVSGSLFQGMYGRMVGMIALRCFWYRVVVSLSTAWSYEFLRSAWSAGSLSPKFFDIHLMVFQAFLSLVTGICLFM